MNIDHLLNQDIIDSEKHSYSPVIKELTPKQLRNIEIRKRIKYILKVLNYLILLAVGVSFLYPFAWMMVMSLRSFNEATQFRPDLILTDFHWENYVEAWNQAKFGYYLGNSVTYAFLVLSLQYFFIVPAAYAFARMEFKGNKALFAIKQLGMMLPAEATLIPVYVFYSKLGLIDTWTGLVMPSLVSMFGIFMFMNHFKTVSSEIVESAVMDKAKNRVIMLRIMIPIIFPVFITHFLITFISNWNSYYWVLVMTNSDQYRTLPVAVRGLLASDGGIMPPWQRVMAGNIMQLAPILLMYIIGNSQMKRAMVGGRKIKFGNEGKPSLIKQFFSLFRRRSKESKKVTTYVER